MGKVGVKVKDKKSFVDKEVAAGALFRVSLSRCIYDCYKDVSETCECGACEGSGVAVVAWRADVWGLSVRLPQQDI